MSGQTNLQTVLDSMQVTCDGLEYGFATIPAGTQVDPKAVLCVFQEAEGLTLIATKGYLESKDISFEGPFAKLTIDVHTSLELVGLTAVLAAKLGENEISANVVAAYYHDHIFVQYDSRSKAIEALNSLQTR